MRERLVRLIQEYTRPMTPLPVDRRHLLESWKRMPPALDRTSPFSVFLFDFYGTLFQSASGEIGLAEVTPGLEAVNFLGPFVRLLPRGTDREGLQALFQAEVRRRHEALRETRLVPEVRVEEVWATVLGVEGEQAREFALRYELSANPVYPMPGVREFLEFLRDRGVVLGIVSNAQFFTPYYVEALLGVSMERLGFAPELTFYSFEFGEAKPSPRLFQAVVETLGRMGYTPEQAVFIGNDMLNDVWAPMHAGFRAALFCGDGRSLRLRREDPRCAGWVPDYVLFDF